MKDRERKIEREIEAVALGGLSYSIGIVGRWKESMKIEREREREHER